MHDYKTYEELVKYLKENEVDYTEINQPLNKIEGMGNWVYDITIEWGDWKHQHARLRWLMEQIGYKQVLETPIETDGSDCYSAVHRYCLEAPFVLFNGEK